MSIENKVPMSDFTEVTDIADTARIIGLQDNENVRIPLQSLIAKTLSRVDEDILTPEDINVEGGVTGFEPIGNIEENDLQAVNGNKIFNFVSNAVEPILFKKGVSNLFDKNKIQKNKDLDNGKIQTTASDRYVVSEYIPLKRGYIYFINNWFDLAFSNSRIGLFKTNKDTKAFKYITKENYIQPSEDCYMVISVDRDTAIPPTDIQVFENIGIVKNTNSEPYLLADKEVNNLTQLNKLQYYNLMLGKLNTLGVYEYNGIGDICTDFIKLDPAMFIFINGLGSENIERLYHFYDSNKTKINTNYKSFFGSNSIFHYPSNAVYIRVNIKDKSELNVLIENISLSFIPFNFKGKLNNNVIDISNDFKYNLLDYRDRTYTKNTALNTEFKINSTEKVKNALVILNIHKGTRPQGFSITERHIHVSNCQNDFSDVGILQNGKLLNIEKHSGNYCLEPLNTLLDRMFQDNTDKTLIGSDNSTSGLFKSIDYGKNWTSIRTDVRVCIMFKNNNIIAQKGKELLLLKKEENYQNGKVIFTSPYDSFIVDVSSFCQSDNGNIYFGTYQSEFDAKIYRSTDNGETFSQVYSNLNKQHIHKIWSYENTIYATIDGATGVFDFGGNTLNKGMLNLKSTDNGNTWVQVNFNWTTDYGLNQMNNGVMYGSGECAVKYCPSLFRSTDGINFEEVFKVPANSQNIRQFNDTLILSTVAYGKFGSAKTFISNDGINFLPIFDTPTIDSTSMSTGLRYGTSDKNNSYFLDENNKKWIGLTSGKTNLGKFVLRLGEDNYQALVYMQCDLEVGENTFTIINSEVNINPIKIIDKSEVFSLKVKENYTHLSNGIKIPHNDCIVGNGVYDSFLYPFRNKGYSRSGEIKVNLNINRVNSIRFGFKNISSQDYSKDLNIFNYTEGISVIKRNGKLVIKQGYTNEFEIENVFRTYYDDVCCDYVLTFTGTKAIVYCNGVFLGEVNCAISDIKIKDNFDVIIGDKSSFDLISNLYLYSYLITSKKSKELFNGFNIV